MYPVWYLDEPDVTRDNPAPASFRVKGWIASPGEIRRIRFLDKPWEEWLRPALAPRPDVTAVYHLPAIGFEAGCPFDKVRDRDSLRLGFNVVGAAYEIVVPVHAARADVAQRKARKLARILPHLACPRCRATDFRARERALVCAGCGAVYPRDARHYDFLSEDLRAQCNVVPTANVSANFYDGVALNIVHSLPRGLILDCGAGLRKKYYENVVNYEIVPYDSTDVLGVAERLPFRDNTFDAVFSFAVLEHLRDPFAGAGELVRVLKPAGRLYCTLPFLQPVHAYPHHYGNMTLKGLENLFADTLKIERLEPLNFGQPIHALSWFLNRYVAGLPAGLQETFKDMKVRDLLRPGDSYLGEPFVVGLAPKAQEELACCNCLLGTKR